MTTLRTTVADPAARAQVHAEAVRSLQAAYAALPRRAPVRLAKHTSNLFRFRPPASAGGLDVSGFGEVLQVDPVTRTADVQGMVTYEDLVDATLPHGLMPLVVPQLKTITLGGAVVGLGIESSSYRNGLAHESVLEMEILRGDGEVVTARPDNQYSMLFRCMPNSYGTLGYALRLRIELEPVAPYVALRHLRYHDAQDCFDAITAICGSGEYEGAKVDFLDGTVFGPTELYLSVGTFTDRARWVSDYTGMNIYYRSIAQRSQDYLRVRDYLWRWDTDWFWCSRALGVQHPLVRRLWPRRYRRSDVYRRIVAFDRRHQMSHRVGAVLGRAPSEPVVQDVEIPVGHGAAFLEFFHREIGITPIWLCPLRVRGGAAGGATPVPGRWPLYPLDPTGLYVNFGFWSSVARSPGQSGDYHNRLIEDEVARLGGQKGLYSTVHYTPEEFWRLYNGGVYAAVKQENDPDGRLPDLYQKCVRAS